MNLSKLSADIVHKARNVIITVRGEDALMYDDFGFSVILVNNTSETTRSFKN